MSVIEGRIEIDLYPARSKGQRVQLSSSRPVHAARVLIGKTPQQALDIIPLLFSICGTAQSRAAHRAICQALGSAADATAAEERARDMLVQVETGKEHMLRLFLDWPKLFYLDNNNDELPWLSRLVAHFRDALFENGCAFSLDSRLQVQHDSLQQLIAELNDYLERHVFGMAPGRWLNETSDIHSLHQWATHSDSITARSIAVICDKGWASQGVTDCDLLPELSTAELQQLFKGDTSEQLIAAPRWQGKCHETSPLARQFRQPLIQALHHEFDNTLITRWLARLVELAIIPQQLQHGAAQLAASEAVTDDTPPRQADGLAQVEAARGRLIHRVQIDADHISHYQVLAPTEWNFHPEGLVTQALDSIASGDSNGLGTLGHILINAIDPCVGYELRIH